MSDPALAMRSLVTGSGERAIATSLHAASPVGVFNAIPILDLADCESPDLASRRALACQLRDFAERVGFFYVVNHGVPDQVVDRAFACAHQFFDMPLEEKMKIDIHLSEHFRGYVPVLSENVDSANRGDLHEGFDIGPENQAFTTSSTTPPKNVWPASLPNEFKEDVMAYWHSVSTLSTKLFRLFALALDLEEDFFVSKTQMGGSMMRLLHYPPQDGIVDERQIGIGAHSDYECFTILAQDEVPALQVLSSDGTWIAADPKPSAFVVNIADQLQRWTNGMLRSTIHRAINRSGRRRYSIPFFFGVDYDVEIAVLPSCLTKERPTPLYEPVKAGEYLQQRLAETYAKGPAS